MSWLVTIRRLGVVIAGVLLGGAAAAPAQQVSVPSAPPGWGYATGSGGWTYYVPAQAGGVSAPAPAYAATTAAPGWNGYRTSTAWTGYAPQQVWYVYNPQYVAPTQMVRPAAVARGRLATRRQGYGFLGSTAGSYRELGTGISVPLHKPWLPGAPGSR